MNSEMKAVVLDQPTAAENVVLKTVDIPAVRPGWLLVKVKAFGMNHSEQILRLNEIKNDYIPKPVIPGIECVGIVEDPGDTGFEIGQKVAALMGGMGRTFPGSYAEYALLPAHHVFTVKSDLPFEQLAAVPETWFTAWGSLFECLHLQKGDRLLIRGATYALGYAAIQIAKACGAWVIATTHKDNKLPLLAQADEAILDHGRLAGSLPKVDKALELVGPKTLEDTLLCMNTGGIVCNTGVLGGIYTLNYFDPIKSIPNGVYLTGFFSNYPDQKTMDDIFAFIDLHNLQPSIGQIFPFSEIQKACIALDYGQVNGKIVVSMDAGE